MGKRREKTPKTLGWVNIKNTLSLWVKIIMRRKKKLRKKLKYLQRFPKPGPNKRLNREIYLFPRTNNF